VWLIVRLRTDAGLTGLGEASDAFGFANTTKQDAARMESELRGFFGLIDGKSPREIGAYRQQGEPIVAKGGLLSATAFSAIEQALWDLAGKSLDAPVCTLFGGRLRDTLQVYANINRATKPRTPAGFAAAAKAAVQDGFRAVKAAPFDGFPAAGSPAAVIDAAVESGIASVAAMREAIGPDVELMVDCHSFFDVPLAERVARRLEPQRLAWYEEPVAPERIAETREIRRRIKQPMAAGEIREGTVKGYLLTIARNQFLAEGKRVARQVALEDAPLAFGNDENPHRPAGSLCCRFLRG
jgi:galactonate dehydratase